LRAASRPLKRSISIAGHRTSVSLEPLFWTALNALAQKRGASIAQIIGEIDGARVDVGLSSAIRQYLMESRGQ